MRNNRDRFHNAFVLHVRPFRNSSQIVELFTEDAGRVGVVARGASRGKSPLSALLQPFIPLQLSWSGRGELHTLGKVEMRDMAYRLPGRRSICGLYANELLMRLLHRGDSHSELFHLYHRLLQALSEGGDEAPLLRSFEVRLLEEIGFGFDLQLDGSGLPIRPDQHYGYHPEQGIVPLAENGVRQFTVMGKTLQWLRSTELDVEKQILREAKQLLRTAIDYHLPVELESRKLIAQYGALS